MFQVSQVSAVLDQVWDVGGQDRIRKLWRYYFENTNALIYVVDSSDRDRIKEAKEELNKMLQEQGTRKCGVAGFCQQTGFAQCHDTCRNHGESWTAKAGTSEVVHSIYSGSHWRWPLRRSGLADANSSFAMSAMLMLYRYFLFQLPCSLLQHFCPRTVLCGPMQSHSKWEGPALKSVPLRNVQILVGGSRISLSITSRTDEKVPCICLLQPSFMRWVS